MEREREKKVEMKERVRKRERVMEKMDKDERASKSPLPPSLSLFLSLSLSPLSFSLSFSLSLSLSVSSPLFTLLIKTFLSSISCEFWFYSNPCVVLSWLWTQWVKTLFLCATFTSFSQIIKLFLMLSFWKLNGKNWKAVKRNQT